jgi:hypothetical protein
MSNMSALSALNNLVPELKFPVSRLPKSPTRLFPRTKVV